MATAASARNFLNAPSLVLPWSSSQQDDVLFRKLTIVLLALLLVLGIALPLIHVPEPERARAEAIPAQLAKLVIEQRKIKLPPPKPKEQPKTEQPKPEAAEAKPAEQPKPEQPKPKPLPVQKPVTMPPPKAQQQKPVSNAPSQAQVEQARQRASQSGLLAMQSTLAQMQQQSANVSNIVAVAPVMQAGAVGDGRKAGSTATRVERSMITGKAGGTSGGISTSGLSRDTGGGGGLAQRSTTQVAAPVGGFGGGGSGVNGGVGGGVAGAGGAGGGGSGKAGGSPARSDETIRAVLESSKGSLYSIYNRSLRQNPALSGKVLFELVIEASGMVSNCRIVSSELGDADLERKLVARLKLLNFGAASVAQYKSRWEVNFLPSG